MRIGTWLPVVGRKKLIASTLLAGAFSVSVFANPPSATPAPGAPKPERHAHHWFQTGKASFYGSAFQGKKTATGERFNMYGLTCAHRTLPLGSWLRVTNLRNRRSIFVRVNDRGPYANNGAVVDLSYEAARKVGLLGKAPVRLEAVNPDDPSVARSLVAQLNRSDLPQAN